MSGVVAATACDVSEMVMGTRAIRPLSVELDIVSPLCVELTLGYTGEAHLMRWISRRLMAARVCESAMPVPSGGEKASCNTSAAGPAMAPRPPTSVATNGGSRAAIRRRLIQRIK